VNIVTAKLKKKKKTKCVVCKQRSTTEGASKDEEVDKIDTVGKLELVVRTPLELHTKVRSGGPHAPT